MFKARGPDLQYVRIALLDRLIDPAQVQRALALQRKISDAGGKVPVVGEMLIEQKLITEDQHKKLLERVKEVEGAITDAQGGVHEVPRRLGQYEIIQRIGRGGMGVVYKAKQLKMDRVVALKVLASHLIRDRKYIKQFVREARAAGQISHRNIVGVHEVGHANGHYFICMEFVEGRPLSRELLAKTRLTPSESLKIAQQVASGLAAVEKQGIVHRDIKPDNLIKTPKGDIKVADLGLAKRLADVTNASQSGWGCGTPHYMAPEQARNSSSVDTRADIYALGATLYHLVTGKVPFDGASSVEVLMRAANDRLVAPINVCPDVPRALSDLIVKMMARDPESRPQTSLELLEDINKARRAMEETASEASTRSKPVSAKLPVSAPGGQNSLLQTVVWSAAVIALLIAVVYFASGKGDGGGDAPEISKTDVEPVDQNEIARKNAARLQELVKKMQGAAGNGSAALVNVLLIEAEQAVITNQTERKQIELAKEALQVRLSKLAGEKSLQDNQVKAVKHTALLRRAGYLANQALLNFRPGEALGFFPDSEPAWSPEEVDQLSSAKAATIAAAKGLKAKLGLRLGQMLAAERLEAAEVMIASVRSGLHVETREWKLNTRTYARELSSASAASRKTLRDEARAASAALKKASVRMNRWAFKGAIRELKLAAAKLSPDSLSRQRLDMALARAERLLLFRNSVIKRLKASTSPVADTVFRNKPAGYVIKGVHSGGLLLGKTDGKGTDQMITWGSLTFEELSSLARHIISRRRGQDQLDLGLLMLTGNRLAEAEKAFMVAEKMPGMARLVLAFRKELETISSVDEETAAENEENQARRALKAGKPAQALGLLQSLLVEHRRTTWVSVRGGVLNKLLDEAQRDCMISGSFSGRTREYLPGCYAIEYDLADDASNLDWSLDSNAAPNSLLWSNCNSGSEVAVSFTVAGRPENVLLLLLPRSPLGGAVKLPALILEASGPRWGKAPLSDAVEGGRGSGRTGELSMEIRGPDVYWATPVASGRSSLPQELLDALSAGKIGGWSLQLDMTDRSVQVSGASIKTRFSSDALNVMLGRRAGKARLALTAALRIGDVGLRLGDLKRVIFEFRDVQAVAAASELELVAALIESELRNEARAALGRFMVLYSSREELVAKVTQLSKLIGPK
jgi:eukaryotic-like serine/threonine-protein kinase